MSNQTIKDEVDDLLRRLRNLTNLQKPYLAYPTQKMQTYTVQKALLVCDLGNLLRGWVKQTQKRALLVVTVVHSLEDFGSYAAIIAQASRTRVNRTQEQMQARAITAFWNDLNCVIPNFKPGKVYQDGLPADDQNPERVSAIVDSIQTPNYKLLQKLKNQGSEIVGTEDIQLLLQERERLKQGIFNSGRDELLNKRDAFISNRINKTLLNEEVAILLIGALHQIEFPDNSEIWKIDFPSLLKTVF